MLRCARPSSPGGSAEPLSGLWRLTAVLACGGLLLAGCSSGDTPAGDAPGFSTGADAALGPGRPTTSEPTPTAMTPRPTPSGGATGTPSPSGSGGVLTVADRAAGLLSTRLPWSGTGRLHTVPGKAAAPGPGRVVRVRVEVEGGLPVDGAAFARFVLATLNDPRSWGHDGSLTFARTSSDDADVRVVLASPTTSARMCRPLITYGKLSCGIGSTAILTFYRWVKAIPGYGSDRTSYRHYVVNHEVGHTLGHHHVYCPGPGRLAPVMMQQTKGLLSCLPNAWPYP